MPNDQSTAAANGTSTANAASNDADFEAWWASEDRTDWVDRQPSAKEKADHLRGWRAARGAEHPAATPPALSVAARYCIAHIDAVLRGGLVADLNEPRGALARVRDALANALREGER